MFCQACGARNQEDAEYCRSCHQKLLVVSGPYSEEDQEAFEANPEEQFSFDEHLLERISILEEVVKRTAETVRGALGTLYKLEQRILANQTGITALRDLLEAKRLLAREEWSELLESRMDYQLLALEKRERFAAVKERIAGLYSGERPGDFHRLLADAEAAFLDFDIERAVARLEEAAGRDPRNHELTFFLGETYFNEGEGEKALGYFRRVLDERPEHFEGLVYSGVLLYEAGEEARAEELLQSGVRLHPDAFLPAFSLGAVYAGQGRLDEAVLFLDRAAAAEAVPQAHFLLGSCRYELGEVGTAIRELEKTVRLDPAFEEAHYLLGLAYLERRWHKKALAALGEAQRLRPQTLQYRDLARLWGRHGRVSRAGRETAATLRQAEELVAGGKVRQALSVYRRALSREPDNATLLLSYAMTCLELERAGEVQSVIDKLLGLEPEERLKATAYATWIEALRREGKLGEGNRIGRLLVGEGSSGLVKSVACCELAYNLAELEEGLDEALGFAESSLALAPAELSHFSLAALGWVRYKRGELAQAVDCLRQASAGAPAARTLTHLGMALLATGERDAARSALVEARRLGRRVGSAGEKLLECLRDSARLLQEMPRSATG